MFQILNFIGAACFSLPALPIELWCIILRLLDPIPLLATAKDEMFFMDVCLGDKILRQKLEEALQIQNHIRKSIAMNPKISRTEVSFSNVSTPCRIKVQVAKEPKRLQRKRKNNQKCRIIRL